MNKETERPINKVVGVVRDWEDAQSLVRQLNDQARACRTLEHGILREGCFVEGVFPLIAQLHDLGYSLEFDTETGEYSPVSVYIEEGTWVYPTIRRS